MSYVLAYVGTVVAFLGLDFIWLGTVATGFYRSRIGSLLLDQPNFVAAGAFYLLYVAGIVYFAVQPALVSGSWTTAAIAGAILGFIAYGTYDMTNLATLKNWSLCQRRSKNRPRGGAKVGHYGAGLRPPGGLKPERGSQPGASIF